MIRSGNRLYVVSSYAGTDWKRLAEQLGRIEREREGGEEREREREGERDLQRPVDNLSLCSRV